MNIKRVMKLKTKEGKAKRLEFPPDFKSLIEKTQTFISLNDPTKRYKFTDEKDSEIANEEDYEKLKSSKENIIKLTLEIVNLDDPVPEVKNNQISSSVVQLDILKSEKIFVKNDNTKENIQKNENDENDLIKSKLTPLLKEKFKQLEDSLVENLYKSFQKQIEKSKLQNQNQNSNNVIHKGISCNNCQMQDIHGIRYKCANCDNYNLCEKCEKLNNHDISHILIKIRNSNNDERILCSKINTTISYKNNGYNYLAFPTEFKFNNECDNCSQQVELKNIGTKSWKENFEFRCIHHLSEIQGEDCKIDSKVAGGDKKNVMLIFNNMKKKLKDGKKEYYCYYQMFNENDETFGNITKFKIIFK